MSGLPEVVTPFVGFFFTLRVFPVRTGDGLSSSSVALPLSLLEWVESFLVEPSPFLISSACAFSLLEFPVGDLTPLFLGHPCNCWLQCT